jgi:hypothetical protein
VLKYYWGSLTFTTVCVAIGAVYGYSVGGPQGVLSVLWIITALSILEVSLSFDNAVVNATVLKDMDEVWRRRFLTWGIIIAVFGMRVIFPLAVVAIAGQLNPWEALKLSVTEPARYEELVTGARVSISGFGGAFLAMVGLKFFFDADKDVHWIGFIERRLAKVAVVQAVEIGLVLLSLYGISKLLSPADAYTMIVSGIFGVLTYIAVEAMGAGLEASSQQVEAVHRSGLAGFMYLQVLDASFSFDGVIGAFALSNNLVIIGLGLGIGAIFVRSMTIHLVERGTLAQYRYLEHGAFWAILALAAIMLLGARYHIPEVVTGLIGAVLIGLSLWWSIRHNRQEVNGAQSKGLT